MGPLSSPDRTTRAFVAAILLAGVTQWYSTGCASGRLDYGDPVNEAQARSVSEVLEDRSLVEGDTVVVSGRVGEVCATAGCWFVLQEVLDDRVYELFTDLKGGADFTVPRKIRGRSAIVRGKIVGERPDLKLAATGLIVE
jgi:hypothetical protein